ncbi:MAG: cysteine desulfurase [Pirellulales bacterium]|nr:cysteine desulfurase [Pirellulales bacterium]
MQAIYLDHNATAPIAPEVAEAMSECYRAGYANPASAHEPGRRARRRLETARDTIGQILGTDTSGANSDRVIFTSGGTEANNLALRGLGGTKPAHAVVSAIEHPSVADVAVQLEREGWRISRLGVTPDGVVQVDQLAGLLRADTRFVAVMLGNNETGVIQPIRQVAEICNEHQVPLHTDAVQAVGKIAVDFRELGVTTMSVTAHKFHGPRGIGALIIHGDVSIEPMLRGGFQQAGIRPGTESVVLAIGMQRALELWQEESHERETRMRELRDSLEAGLRQGWPELVINGQLAPRLPHTSNVSFPGIDRQALLMALDVAGVACSTGSACASGSSEPSPVLLAMGADEAVVGGSLRLSLGASTTALEVDEAVRKILACCGRLSGEKRASEVGQGLP